MPKKICMLAYTCYETDNRVRRYAEALATRGDHVDVIALSRGEAPLGMSNIRGVTVYNVQQRKQNDKVKWVYLWRLLRFLWTSSLFISNRHRKDKYDFIHVHNVPDFLVFAAWYPRLTGAKIVLDIHDIVPELFVSKFNTRIAKIYFNLMALIEKASCAFVDHVIVANHLWFERLVSRSVPGNKCSVYLNNVDLAIFYRRQRTRTDGNFIVLFPGTFQRHQGLDIAIQAFASLSDKSPRIEFHLYGPEGVLEDQLRSQVRSLGLEEQIRFCGLVTLDRVPEIIANADLGIVPKRADTFGNEAYSTKILEFMSQGVPVVVSRTAIDSYYFDDSVVRFFPSGDSAALAEAILQLLQDGSARERLVARGNEYVEANSWDRRKGAYFQLVDGLCAGTLSTEAIPSNFARSMETISRPSDPDCAGRASLQADFRDATLVPQIIAKSESSTSSFRPPQP